MHMTDQCVYSHLLNTIGSYFPMDRTCLIYKAMPKLRAISKECDQHI